MRSIVLALPVFAALLAGCGPSRKATAPAADALPALPVSEIDIPIRIAVRPLLEKAESTVPALFTSDRWPDFTQPSCDFRYKYRFIRSALQVECRNNLVGVRFGGTYQVAGSKTLCTAGLPVTPWVNGGCGFGNEPMRQVNLAIKSLLQFQPGYRVRSTTVIDQVQPLNKCQVSVFSTDITQLVMDSIRSSLNAFAASIDKTIAALSFDNLLTRVQDSSHRRIPLGPYGFLVINPVAVRIGQLNLDRDSLAISAGMSCRPAVGSAFRSGNPPLPPLQAADNRRGIKLYVEAVYDYAYLNRLLDDSLRNRVFDVRGRTIVVKGVKLSPAGNGAIGLQLVFAGSNSGTLNLRGTPTLDTAVQTVSIPDVAYSMDGADLTLKIASSLFANKIRRTIRGNAYLDVAALVRTHAARIDSALNRNLAPGVRSTGHVQAIRLLALRAEAEAVHVQFALFADLAVSSDGKL